ncbi:X-pro dipeptidyl-peptidase c-terminal non-catalytic domain-containing protein [Colletotrichum higginsianum IMI 349063]|uniref:X-pro dipeptidyl-peptidase c-terminal non-catalytic domain-containing protein n=1 Tax=Colletotrichum higginsianum (strain IMI 349063) TaxID=759273 RepID=A0A1B7YH25_COLHI|nr:X-pro dipeptidyl-peptidase c-terminal non-catalytic domain-containing protein [Colletotrichum higginsianum IMI 349063]OBR11118.1 X-pro dipeptidyl-peptidase c-terminal non-catalytic domain-containing protein [Colletotrichum higginsianum IMI 349063]
MVLWFIPAEGTHHLTYAALFDGASDGLREGLRRGGIPKPEFTEMTRSRLSRRHDEEDGRGNDKPMSQSHTTKMAKRRGWTESRSPRTSRELSDDDAASQARITWLQSGARSGQAPGELPWLEPAPQRMVAPEVSPYRRKTLLEFETFRLWPKNDTLQIRLLVEGRRGTLAITSYV